MRVLRIGLISLAALAIACAKLLPSDDSLIKRFRENRESFERIASIALAEITTDSMFVSIPSFDSTSARRHADAWPIVKSLDITNVFAKHDRVEFEATGDYRLGTRKGWMYVPSGGSPPLPGGVVSSLDGADKDMGSYEMRYRPIDDGWYLYIATAEHHNR